MWFRSIPTLVPILSLLALAACGGKAGNLFPCDDDCVAASMASTGGTQSTTNGNSGTSTGGQPASPSTGGQPTNPMPPTNGNTGGASSSSPGNPGTGGAPTQSSDCFLNGTSYSSGTTGITAPDGCNTCTCNEGRLACTEVACKPAGEVVCGGFAGDTCAPNEYCAYEGTGWCGAADASALCKARPDTCDQNYAPVCGCDGKTYPNSCAAAMAGVGYLALGDCAQPSGSCAIDGKVYANGESNIPAADGCNTCTCSDGNLACTKRACPDRLCGGIAALACSDGEYCQFPVGQCKKPDASGLCRPRPDTCDTVFKPVCGCNGMTYGNACEAWSAGTSVATEGTCNADND